MSSEVNPTLIVLLYSSLAAGVSAAGVLPLLGRDRIPTVAIGWANALASGLMLGAAYLLMAAGLDYDAWIGGLGAALGIAYVWFTHAAAGTEELDLNRVDETSEVYGYKVLLVNTLHSTPEGIAIGAAAMVNVPFGIFVALAMAVHNIPEATALSAILRARGVRLRHAAGLAVMTNVTQVLLAVVTFAVLLAAPGSLPWTLGFAVGSLIYLVVSELLPESYRQAGHTTIALLTIAAMGIVVLLGGLPR
ncbi:MAG: ZIP family metal transporter [Gemmatimonadota bacterium]